MRMDVRVDASGAVSAGVTDVDTGDPYTLFLVEEVAGGFVGSVRADYERVLSDIAERCCEKEIFKLPQTKELIAYAREKFGDEPEYLWEKTPDNAILRRPDNRKWYAAILTVRRNRLGGEGEEKTEAVDLRADPTFIAEDLHCRARRREKVPPRLPHEQTTLVHRPPRRHRSIRGALPPPRREPHPRPHSRPPPLTPRASRKSGIETGRDK